MDSALITCCNKTYLMCFSINYQNLRREKEYWVYLNKQTSKFFLRTILQHYGKSKLSPHLSFWIPCVDVFPLSVKRCHNILFRLKKCKLIVILMKWLTNWYLMQKPRAVDTQKWIYSFKIFCYYFISFADYSKFRDLLRCWILYPSKKIIVLSFNFTKHTKITNSISSSWRDSKEMYQKVCSMFRVVCLPI